MTKPTKETIEQYRKIIADAPESMVIEATHIDNEGFYWSLNGLQYYTYNKIKTGWYAPTWDVGLECMQSLDNLREIVALYDENQAKGKRITELEREREVNYEKWQKKYQHLKDSASLTQCYECGALVGVLSPRSRCCMCEYKRAKFNESENEQLRKQQEGSK